MIKVTCLYPSDNHKDYISCKKILNPENYQFDEINNKCKKHFFPKDASTVACYNHLDNQNGLLWIKESIEEIWDMINKGSNKDLVE